MSVASRRHLRARSDHPIALGGILRGATVVHFGPGQGNVVTRCGMNVCCGRVWESGAQRCVVSLEKLTEGRSLTRIWRPLVGIMDGAVGRHDLTRMYRMASRVCVVCNVRHLNGGFCERSFYEF